MSLIQHQMSIANQILEKILPIDPHSILAGGAPRDWFFGNPASDLDIYFHAPSLNTWSVTKKVFKSVGIVIQDVTNSHPLYKRNPDIYKVYSCSFEGMDIHFIQMAESTFKCAVQSFALSISSIYYKNGRIVPTRDFLRSVNHHAIVKINEVYADGDAYIRKIKAKFPTFKYYKSYEALAQHLLDKGIQ